MKTKSNRFQQTTIVNDVGKWPLCFLLALVVFAHINCVSNLISDHKAYKRLQEGIIDGAIHKGMAIYEVVAILGEPHNRTGPTIINGVKVQVLIYRYSDTSRERAYHLYFVDDALKEWKQF